MAALQKSHTVFRHISKKPSVVVRLQQARALSLHEYQSKNLLHEFKIPVPKGRLVSGLDEVKRTISEIEGPWVLKSQILAGGRGRGTFDSDRKGGIRIARRPDDAVNAAKNMLGHRLSTKQTNADGVRVDALYVEETIDYDSEFYLAMTIDRSRYCPVVLLSKQGGIDIETTSKEHPEQLHKFWFSVRNGITPDTIADIRAHLGFSRQESENIGAILQNMFELFVAKDATLLEINPLVRTPNGHFLCLDAKFTFDNAAEKRQPDLFALRDRSQELSDETEAEKYGLVYIRLEGNIGNVVNGAGLAMATNDAVELYGGSSANFLDAGGQATTETMLGAFKIILGDPRVKVILVNIYGGIIRCDMIAESIIAAAAEIGPLKHPMVVRLQGTNSEAGLKLIAESGLGLHTESEFGRAAQKAVELAAQALGEETGSVLESQRGFSA